MRIDKYLNDLMSRNKFKRDKDLADWLGVSPAAVSQYRAGTRSMDNEKCVKVALELGVDPLQVIMATDMDKADRTGQQSLWAVFSQRMAATAASAVLCGVVTLFLTAPAPAQAKTLSVDNNINYAKFPVLFVNGVAPWAPCLNGCHGRT